MPTIEEARHALELDQLQLPDDVPIDEVRVEEYIDSDGEDSLSVQVVLSESADVSAISGDTLLDIKDRISERLRAIGFRLFSYISFVKLSELNPQ